MFARRKQPRRWSTTAGSYFSNAFSIQISEDTSVIDPDTLHVNHDDATTLSIFVHEYWHYLQNLTTVAGFVSLLLQQDLAASFSATLAEGGTSIGSADDELTNEITELIDVRNAREGELELVGHEPDDIDCFVIIGVEEAEYSLCLRGQPVPLAKITLNVEIELKDGSKASEQILFGQACVEEGVAYLVDRKVAGAGTGKVGADDAPPFPYWILRELAVSGGTVDMTAIEIASLGTLALLTSDPADMFLSVRDHYAQLRQEEIAVPEALNTVWQNMKPSVEAAIKQIVDVELPGLNAMYAGRGLLESAFDWLTQLYETVLCKRLDDPLFDLRPFSNNAVDKPVLADLLRTVLPCDAHISRLGSMHAVERDVLVTFGQPGASIQGHSLSDYLRTLESQTHYVNSHLDYDDVIPTTELEIENADLEDDEVDPCPFYTSCGLALRRNNEESCFRNPWRNFTPATNNCWYGAAVSCTLGPTNVTEIVRDPRELAEQHQRVLNAVRKRAFEIWKDRGGHDGNDHADWYQARFELGIAADYSV